MTLMVFSRKGIHYTDSQKGNITALFVPAHDQVRRFSDIPQINEQNVQARYGETSQRVLWRQVGAGVVVYGLMNKELASRRQGVEVYLPQDFVPPDSDAFYLVFGEQTVIHGARSINEEGQETWGLSMLDARAGAATTLVDAVSERLMQGVPENVCVAVKGPDSLIKDIQRAVHPFGLRAVDFTALQRRKAAKTLYVHRDFSLLMVSIAFFSLLILFGAVAYLVLGVLKLDSLEHDIAQLEEQIRRIQMDSPLSNIQDPQAILREMQQPLVEPPSAIVHAAADVGTEFGPLQSISFRNDPVEEYGPDAGQMMVDIQLEQFENQLLVYQEELAKSTLRDRPWIRSIERLPSGQNAIRLKLQVKEPLE